MKRDNAFVAAKQELLRSLIVDETQAAAVLHILLWRRSRSHVVGWPRTE